MISLDVLLHSDALARCFTLLFSAASTLGTTVGFVVAGSVAHGSKMNPKAPKKMSKINEYHRKRTPERGQNFAEVEPPLWIRGRIKNDHSDALHFMLSGDSAFRQSTRARWVRKTARQKKSDSSMSRDSPGFSKFRDKY